MAEKQQKKRDYSKVKRKRSTNLQLRLSAEEKLELQEQAERAGMSVTDFVLYATRRSEIIVVNHSVDLLQELRRQGNNLNQAVWLAYQNGYDTSEIQAAVAKCIEVQEQLIQRLKDWDAVIRKGDGNGGNTEMPQQ